MRCAIICVCPKFERNNDSMYGPYTLKEYSRIQIESIFKGVEDLGGTIISDRQWSISTGLIKVALTGGATLAGIYSIDGVTKPEEDYVWVDKHSELAKEFNKKGKAKEKEEKGGMLNGITKLFR